MSATNYIKVTAIIIPDEATDTAIGRYGLKQTAHAVVDAAMTGIEAGYPDVTIAVVSELCGAS